MSLYDNLMSGLNEAIDYEKGNVQKNIEYTLATLDVEKLVPSDEAIRLCEEISNGQISMNDAIASIKKKYKL